VVIGAVEEADMETIREPEIQLVHDKEFEEEVGPYHGKYLGTFLSARGQVRADLFDEGPQVIAHISFPTGMDVTNVEDRYLTELRSYAAAHGFGDRFRVVYADY
jgi:nitric oxide synthase oxygenase domain/subunit